MTLAEWTAHAIAELKATGFEATEHQGFPLVATPPTLDGKRKLLDLRLSFSCEKRVYAEGVLLVPV